MTSAAQWRGWRKRAETIERKGRELLADLMVELGEEHEITDFADNIIHAAESVLEWTDRARKPTPPNGAEQ